MKPKNTWKHNVFNTVILFVALISVGASYTVTAAQISGFVWLDHNANGLQDTGEPGFSQTISGVGAVNVTLYPEGSDNFTATTALDENSDGNYRFDNIPFGHYYLCMSREYDVLGLSVTTQNAGNDAIDNDFDDSPCAYNIAITNTIQTADFDLGLVGGSSIPSQSDPNPDGNFNGMIVKTDSLSINHQWRSAGSHLDTQNSVVFFSAPTSHDNRLGVVRMRRSNSGTEFKFQPWSNFNNRHLHNDETINIVSLQQGRWQANNTRIEIGRTEVNGTRQWKTIHFAQAFSTPPTVQLSLQTSNGADAVDVRARRITTDSMQIALFEEEKKIRSGHVFETVGYLLIASDSVNIELNNVELTRIELSQLAINHDWKTIGNGHQIRLEEDQTKDLETAHAFERVHVVKIDNTYLTQIASSVGGDPGVLRSRTEGVVDPANPVDPPSSETGNQVSGLVWLDNNADGLRNHGEPGFAQAVPEVGFMTVALYPEGSTEFLDVALLDEASKGRYLFKNVPAGDYYLCTNTVFELLGLSATTQDAGNDSIDSDFDFYPCTYGVSVSGGQVIKRDLGLVGEISDSVGGQISGTVWVDTNQNALFDASEAGAGAVVGIYALPEKVGSFVKHIATDGSGFYEFTNLAPREYRIEVNGDSQTRVVASVSETNSNVSIDFPVNNNTAPIKVDGTSCTLENALILRLFGQKIGACAGEGSLVLEPDSHHLLGGIPRPTQDRRLSSIPFSDEIVIYGNGARIDRISTGPADSSPYAYLRVSLTNVALDSVRSGAAIFSFSHADIGSISGTHDASNVRLSHSQIGDIFHGNLYRVNLTSSTVTGNAVSIAQVVDSNIEGTLTTFPFGSKITGSSVNKLSIAKVGGANHIIENSTIGGVFINNSIYTAPFPSQSNNVEACFDDKRVLDPQCLLDINDGG